MNIMYNFIINIFNINSFLGIIINCILIVLESIIPPLPLGLFITILCINYGYVIGFIISWVFTIIGCIISYYLFKNLPKNINKKLINNKYSKKLLFIIDNLSFPNLVLLISLPITPAFLINIVAGVSNMKVSKFLYSIMFGKISLIVFWGYVGTSLIESLKNPLLLINVGIIMVIMFVISKILNKKLKLD